MLILINKNILPKVPNVKYVEVLQYQMEMSFVNMLQYLVLIRVYWYILIIKKETS